MAEALQKASFTCNLKGGGDGSDGSDE